MNWLLIVIVLNSPVKTDLSFNTLNACLSAEQTMRAQWTEVFNAAVRRGATKDSLELLKMQMTQGTCIPTKE